MTLPTFDALKHDIGLDGFGFMRSRDREGVIQRQDLVPATARAAKGEGRYDSFQSESFIAQATVEGGLGQARFEAQDGALTGVADTRWSGRVFPARKVKQESDGGTTSHYFNRGTTLYGLTANAVETIGSATSHSRTAGTVLSQPRTDGFDNAFWCQNESGTYKAYRYSGAASPTDITPYGLQPSLIERYGKWMWLLGKRQLVATPTVVSTTTGTEEVTYADVPPGAGVVLIIQAYDTAGTADVNGISDGLGSFNSGSIASTVFSESFESPEASNSEYGKTWFLYATPRAITDNRAGMIRVTMDPPADDVRTTVMIVNGVDEMRWVDTTTSNTNTTSNTSSTYVVSGPNTGTLSNAKQLVINAVTARSATRNISGIAPDTGWTEVSDASIASSPSRRSGVYYQVTSTTTGVSHSPTVTRSGSGADSWHALSAMLVLYGSPLSADSEAFSMAYSTNDGTSWTFVSSSTATGIGDPIASFPAHGFLWFTTRSGLYRVAVTEQAYTYGANTVTVAIQQMDAWTLPYDATHVGTWLASYGGLAFNNVGQTIRRNAPGQTTDENDNTVWPPGDWATIGGAVRSLVAGEGGVYFSAGGYLWCYNTKGFHCLATEPDAGAFDTLFWHQGRLYFRGDPARYFDFRYPSLRPDAAGVAVGDMDTGYLILSSADFEKVNVDKIIRQFETQGYFTAGANATESGTITLAYTVGDAGISDPGRYGGAASALTWTSIGTHSVTDKGSKAYKLGTPLQAKSIYLRVTLTPGTVGYPVLTGVTAYGRAVMPPTTRIVAPIQMYASQRDKQGNILYTDDNHVKEAIDKLRALRANVTASATNKYYTVNFVDEIGGVEDYLVTSETLNDWLVRQKGTDGMHWTAQVAMVEIP